MRQMRIFSTRRFLLPATACGALVLGGCYRHVVRAEGPGSETYNLYTPNLQEEEDKPAPKNQAKTEKVPSKKAESENAATKPPAKEP